MIFNVKNLKVKLKTLFPLGLFALLMSPVAAFADRIVYFDAIGFNRIVERRDQVLLNTYISKCVVSIVNTSANEQRYEIQFTGVADSSFTPPDNGSGHGATYFGPSAALRHGSMDTPTEPLTGTILGNTRKSWTWSFPAAPVNVAVTQQVRCQGNIKVGNVNNALPGFVTANGMIITWMQTSRPGDSSGVNFLKAVTSIQNSSFPIGENKPF